MCAFVGAIIAYIFNAQIMDHIKFLKVEVHLFHQISFAVRYYIMRE